MFKQMDVCCQFSQCFDQNHWFRVSKLDLGGGGALLFIPTAVIPLSPTSRLVQIIELFFIWSIKQMNIVSNYLFEKIML